MNNRSSLWQEGFQSLFGIGGMAALALMILGVLVIKMRPRWKWPLLGLAVYLASMARNFNVRLDNKLIPPLELLRNLSRPMCGAILFLLAAVIFLSPSARRSDKQLRFGSAQALLAFQAVMAALQMAAGDETKGILALATYILMYIVLFHGLRHWLEEKRGPQSLLLTMTFSSALFVAATLFQAEENYRAIVLHGRLLGTTGNAQSAAVLLGISILPCVFLAQSLEAPWRKVAALALSGTLLSLLLWTGSRTGIGLTLVGITLLGLGKPTRLALRLVGLAAAVLIGMELLPEDAATHHVLSMQDTRSYAWKSLWAAFLSSPLLGVPFDVQTKTESSYLFVAARFGLIGLIPMVVFVWLTLKQLLFLWQKRSIFSEHEGLLRLATAGLGAMAAAAFFEGFLAGTYSYPVFYLYLYLALLAFLERRAREASV